jgi:WD40 repeat protein
MAPNGSRAFLMAAAIIVAVAVAACGGPAPSGSPLSTAEASADPSPATASVAPTSSATIDRPIASSGSIAVRGSDGSLSIVDADGNPTLLSDAANGAFGFPTWSPDGSRIAAVRASGASAEVVVFDPAASGDPVEPVVLFDNEAIAPFYLFWAPDGEAVSFLATEANVLALRIAPTDGSAPIDGSGRGTTVRTGNPFYYDWIGRDRLIAHIGEGPEAFLGEIGLDGVAADEALADPGEFRSAVVNRDQTAIAFVRGRDRTESAIVVAARDGSGEHTMTVFGPAAMAFDPTGTTLGTIGPNEPVPPDLGFPIGPLRLIDAASGEVRTLLDGFVVGFWWSPDGQTIAALRVQPALGSASGASLVPSPTPIDNEPRLVFVDVASGKVRSQPVVQPGERFIDTFLIYFDQYALSHRIWAPDSSSFLLPEALPDGSTQLTVRFPDGEPPVMLDGDIGFWSP